MAALRADLRDPVADVEAAGAVLEVRPPGLPPSFGVADIHGRVAVLFPYPEPPTPPVGPGSPQPGQAGSPSQQSWTVRVRARYAPQGPPPAFPDLCDTLNQGPATLWADSDRLRPLTEAVLRFGQDLVVRTVDAVTLAPLSVLYVTAGASPL
jgi:hypothetical protein